jgi:amino acid transporter
LSTVCQVFIAPFHICLTTLLVDGWPDGYAFILSLLAPLWTICKNFGHHLPRTHSLFHTGSFDSSVHISEEAANAATAVPWAIVTAIFVAGVLGWGMFVTLSSLHPVYTHLAITGINMSLAFCMGTDLQALAASPQPMAQIFLQGFGRKGTLAIWSIVVLVQCVGLSV